MDRIVLVVLAIVLLAGCTAPPAAAREATFEGQAVATGTAFRAAHAFDVPAGTGGINATLTWNGTGAALGLELFAPNGTRAALAARSNAGQLALAFFETPAVGRWVVYVVGDVGAPTPYRIHVRMPADEPVNNTLTRNALVRPGSFLEVDVLLQKDATFAYVVNATAPVRWDVHAHQPEGLRTYHTGENATHHEGTFTAPVAGTYSLIATPQGEPARIRLDLTGRFEAYG